MDKIDEYDLQDVVDAGDWGAEPGEDYNQSLDMLDNVVRECIWVSNRYAGIASPEGRHSYASVMFAALITRGVSLLNLAPHSPWATKKIEHWNYASMTGVVPYDDRASRRLPLSLYRRVLGRRMELPLEPLCLLREHDRAGRSRIPPSS